MFAGNVKDNEHRGCMKHVVLANFSAMIGQHCNNMWTSDVGLKGWGGGEGTCL